MKKTIRTSTDRHFGFAVRTQYASDGSQYWTRSAIDFTGKPRGHWTGWSPSTKEAHDSAQFTSFAVVKLPKVQQACIINFQE